MKTNDNFKEVDQQASKEFAVEEWAETCRVCNGHGSLNWTKTTMRMKSSVVGFVYTAETCTECNGTGEIEYEKPQQ